MKQQSGRQPAFAGPDVEDTLGPLQENPAPADGVGRGEGSVHERAELFLAAVSGRPDGECREDVVLSAAAASQGQQPEQAHPHEKRPNPPFNRLGRSVQNPMRNAPAILR